MPSTKKSGNLNFLILGLAGFKLLIHLLTNTNYTFHRDAFLYLNEAKHLSWGFMEIPPMVPFLGKIMLLFGDSVFIIRFLPALVGAITVVLIGLLVKDLGGKRWAILLACFAFIVSPAFLRSNTLFQPVSFNQFCWFLSAFFLVRLLIFEKSKYWYFLGIAAGLGFLTKYSIVFYLLGLLIAFLFSPHRKWLKTRHPYLALGLALLIAAPNLIWQFNHHWPVIAHMEELSERQLVNVNVAGFITMQFLAFLAGSIFWLAGLYFLFFKKQFRDFRFIGIGFFLTFVTILLLGGKAYYTFGSYTILFVFGGLGLAELIQKPVWKAALLGTALLITLPVLPFALPVLPVDQMLKYCAWFSEKTGIVEFMRWEDGKLYPLPQDYADMQAWEEMVAKTAKFYHSLSQEEQQNCMIWGAGYHHAGAINFYREKYNLPEAYSLSSSFMIWAPDTLDFDRQILLDEEFSMESQWFNTVVLVDSIENPYSRDPGYLYYRTDPKIDVKARWTQEVTDRKKRFGFD